MFLWFTSILTLAAAAADIIHYRRLRRRGTSARNLRLFVALAAATDALPPVIALTDALSRDNTTGFMLFMKARYHLSVSYHPARNARTQPSAQR